MLVSQLSSTSPSSVGGGGKAVADTGGVAMVSAENPLKERAPLIRDGWYREEQKSP